MFAEKTLIYIISTSFTPALEYSRCVWLGGTVLALDQGSASHDSDSSESVQSLSADRPE